MIKIEKYIIFFDGHNFRVIAVMLNEIVKEIDAIYDLSGYTATLDIILSFATVSWNFSILWN